MLICGAGPVYTCCALGIESEFPFDIFFLNHKISVFLKNMRNRGGVSAENVRTRKGVRAVRLFGCVQRKCLKKSKWPALLYG